MSKSREGNTERNARIIVLASQGKAPAEIARELGVSRGIVAGVIRRARDAGTLPKAPPKLGKDKHDETGLPPEGQMDSVKEVTEPIREALYHHLEEAPTGEQALAALPLTQQEPLP